VASIPFLVDTVGGMRTKPLIVHASRATLQILRNHLFNWAIWPDFTEIPTPEAPFLRYEELELGGSLELAGRRITPIPARHTVPAVGYHLDSGAASLVFTGDTGPNEALWKVVNRIANLKYLIIETAFSNKERQLAEISRHLCPSMLAEELKKLERNAEIYITHMKPGEIEPTMLEIEECAGAFRPRMLQNNLVLEF
jgi:cAMP phosphodiesterase